MVKNPPKLVLNLDENYDKNEICEENAGRSEISEDVEENTINSMDKNTNLHFNAAFGMIDNLNQELESRKQIDSENFMGWTPLMMACRNGRIEAVKILLEKGADVTKKNKLGANIFGLAIATGKLDLVEIILRHMLRGGISRNRIQDDLSPLSLAILFRKSHLINWLIQQGFDFNAATSKTLLTPLMFAAAVKNEKIINLLELKGANKLSKNFIGMDYTDISLWGKKGLGNLQIVASNKRELKAPFGTDHPADKISPLADLSAKTPTEIKSCLMPPTYKVPNNTPCGVLPQKKVYIPPVCEYFMMQSPSMDQNQATSSSDYHSENNGPENIFNFENNKQYLCQNYMPSYNVLYPNFVPVMNSTCGLTSPNPVVTSTSPLVVASPFQNFVSTMKRVPQNSPITLMSLPQHECKNPVGMQVFLSPQVQIEPKTNYFYTCDDQKYDQTQENEVYYHMVSTPQEMYVIDSICKSPA